MKRTQNETLLQLAYQARRNSKSYTISNKMQVIINKLEKELRRTYEAVVYNRGVK